MSWLAGGLPEGMNYLVLEGVESFVHSRSTVFGPVSLGRFSILREGVFVVGASPISIGAFTDIGVGSQIVTHQEHMPFLPSTFIFGDVLGMEWSRGCGLQGLDAEKREVDPRPIRIGNDVSVGERSTIVGGVTLGDGCVIRAQSFVNRDCEPFGVYEGVPARFVGWRFPEAIRRQIAALAWWDWPLDQIQRNATFFAEDFASHRDPTTES